MSVIGRKTIGTVAVSKEDLDLLDIYHWNIGTNGYMMRNKKLGVNRWSVVYLHQDIGDRIGLKSTKSLYIDHINRDKLDNRRENLRNCTPAQSALNIGVRADNKSSGVRGVTWDKEKRKWYARLQLGGRIVWWGRFNDLADAIHERRVAEKKYYGEYGAW